MSISKDLVEEIVGCIFDCGLSESDAVDYVFATLNEEPQSQWVSVDDRLPPMTGGGCSDIVDLIVDGERVTDCRYLYGIGCWSDYAQLDIPATHWVYAPTPPKESYCD